MRSTLSITPLSASATKAKKKDVGRSVTERSTRAATQRGRGCGAAPAGFMAPVQILVPLSRPTFLWRAARAPPSLSLSPSPPPAPPRKRGENRKKRICPSSLPCARTHARTQPRPTLTSRGAAPGPECPDRAACQRQRAHPRRPRVARIEAASKGCVQPTQPLQCAKSGTRMLCARRACFFLLPLSLTSERGGMQHRERERWAKWQRHHLSGHAQREGEGPAHNPRFVHLHSTM